MENRPCCIITQGFLIPLKKSLFYLYRKVSTLVQGSKIVKRKVSDVKNLATAFVYFLCPSNYEILPRSYMRQEIVDVGNIFLDYKNTSARKKIKIISNFSYGNSFHIKSNETKMSANLDFFNLFRTKSKTFFFIFTWKKMIDCL